MSDLALAWIISEVDLVGQRDPAAAFKWSEDRVGLFGRRYKKHKEQAMGSPIHGSLRFSSGTGLFTVLLWKLLGIPPLFASRYLVRLANKIKEWFPLVNPLEPEEKYLGEHPLSSRQGRSAGYPHGRSVA